MIEKGFPELGHRFAEILKRKNLNDSSLGKIAGISGTAIKNIIKNGAVPKADVIFNISSKLDISYYWILEGVNPFEREKKEVSIIETPERGQNPPSIYEQEMAWALSRQAVKIEKLESEIQKLKDTGS